MAVTERRSIGELVALHKLEPQLRDVFVEGRQDRRFFSWFIAAHGATDVTVYEIAALDIPSSLIQSRGLHTGRRGAVITLALELCDQQSPPAQVTCIADRDGDYPARFDDCELLLFTDFTSLEMYFFDPRVLAKVLTIAAERVALEAEEVLRSLTPILMELFAVRQANLVLALFLEPMSFDRCCSLSGSDVAFDAQDYISRYLSKGAKLSSLSTFYDEFERQKALPVDDRRMRINGHDFVELLAWYVNKQGVRPSLSAEDVSNLLATSAERAWLLEHNLFAELLRRLR